MLAFEDQRGFEKREVAAKDQRWGHEELAEVAMAKLMPGTLGCAAGEAVLIPAFGWENEIWGSARRLLWSLSHS